MFTRLYIGNPHEGYITDEVSSIPTQLANLCQETREKFVTDLAAISRGKDESKNPSVRFKALLKEAAPNSKDDITEGFQGLASRPMEFCPIICEFAEITNNCENVMVLVTEKNLNDFENGNYKNMFSINKYDFYNKILKYSYSTECDYDSNSIILYTNLRTLLNAGVPYDEIPFLESISYKQYGSNKDDLFIVIGTEKTSIYDININYDTNVYDKNMPLIFKITDLLESGYTYEDVIKDFKEGHCYVDNKYKQFKAIKIKIPMFIWSQWPMTHTALSKESQSDRVAEGVGYWLPEGIINKINEATEEEIDKIDYSQEFEDLKIITSSNTPNTAKTEAILTTFTKILPQDGVQQILKAAGYKREIWSRAPYYFKYKECVVTGWYNDPTTWQHSFLERSVEPDCWKNWTQKETKEVLQAIKEIIER